MKSILILGASSLQVPLINYVKKQGYRTIVVSIPGKYPGFDLADRSIYCDVRDADAILSQISNEEIVSVLTDETDISVPTVAVIAERLGIRGNNPKTAIAYSNKYIMRESCRKANIPVPNFIHISKDSDIEKLCKDCSFPAIMKPEDNQGSRGIHKVNSLSEIKDHLEETLSFSTTNRVILEDFFVGNEFVVEGFVINGQYINWGIAERRYFDLKDKYIPCQTIFPANIDDTITHKLINSEIKLHNYLKPTFGMTHSEYIVNEKGEYILVETSLRGGGVFISSHLIPLYTGYDNYSLLLGCSLGNSYKVEDIKFEKKRRASAYMCFYLAPGVVESIEGIDKVLSLPQVILANFENLYIGMQIKPIVNKTQRFGPIILSADNRDILEEKMSLIRNNLKIVVKTSHGKEFIRWK